MESSPDRGDRQPTFWRRRLAGASILNLPTDRSRPVARDGELRHSQSLRLPRSAVEAWDDLTFPALIAAWVVFLRQHSGQSDFVLGIDHGKGLRLLRLDLTGDPSFAVLCQRASVEWAAIVDVELPLAGLHSLLPPPPAGHLPVFQSLMTFAPADSDASLPPRDISLHVDLSAGTFWLSLAADLFVPRSAGRLARRFVGLLQAAARQAKTSVARLPTMTAKERKRVLVEWNQTALPLGDTTRDLTELVGRWTAQQPNTLALRDDEVELSYADLGDRSDRLAHRLRDQEVKAEQGVGILLQRSVDAVVAILATLKAGGFFIPLDPSAPALRLRRMVEQCETRCVITRKALVPILDGLAIDAVLMDAVLMDAPLTTDFEHVPALPNQLAYVIYTSGSTGELKGVGGHHGAVHNLIRDLDTRLPIQPGTACAWTASPVFDVAIGEIFGCLGLGGTLVVAPTDIELETTQLFSWLAAQGISITELAAGQLLPFIDWLQDPDHRDSLSLEALTVGTEPIPERWLRAIRAHLPSLEIINFYGPTETTVECTTWRLTGDPRPGKAPIGRPQSNVQVYVLDPLGLPVPPGVVGELLIGGAGVARGYLGQPAATAERFVPDSLSQADQSSACGGRLYRTGDLVRYLDTGSLEFVGRTDAQLKIRGYRIEPGEVEAALREHPAVADAVVLSQKDGRGQKDLVAFALPAFPGDATSPDLRGFLRQRLPADLVPSVMQFLDEFPRTASGKVHRAAFPQVDLAHLAEDLEPTGPRGPIETTLLIIWSELLRLEHPGRLGIHHHFFDLGGHSLLATQLASRIRDHFGINLPVKEIFERPTVADLASAIAAQRQEESGVHLVPIVRPESWQEGQHLPLSFAQERMWIARQWNPDTATYNIPVASRLLGPLNVGALQQALGELVHRHSLLRTHLVVDSGRPRQVVKAHHDQTLEVRDLAKEDDPEALALAILTTDLEHPFRFDAPRFRARLLRLGDELHILSLVFGHSIFDNRSEAILSRELHSAYQMFDQQKATDWPGLPVQYADFAIWQQRWYSGEQLEAQLDYWRRRLRGAGEPLELPLDRARSADAVSRCSRVEFGFPASFRQRLDNLSRQCQATVFMTLLAAFKALLSRWTGRRDIIIGSLVDGRNQSELENLIGMFSNMLVLRTDVAGNPTFAELVERVRGTVLSALDHQDLPFEKLAEQLQPEREPDRNPFFQVTFRVMTGDSPGIQLPGLSSAAVDIPRKRIQFDLELEVQLREDGGLVACFDYASHLFERSTILHFARHWHLLIEDVLQDPQKRLAELQILSASERRELLVESNATSEYPRSAHLIELFEHQVRRRGDQLATIYGQVHRTFAELDQQSIKISHTLRQLGVGPETAVGIYLRPSGDRIAAILGVLRAGGVYLPLDPGYPVDRIEWMLEDSEASVLLTESDFANRFQAPLRRTLYLDRDWQDHFAAQPDEALAPTLSARSAACLLYTSGATGQPKGVIINHRGIVSLVVNTNYVQIDPGDRIAQLSNASFDALSFEVWAALLNGGCLVGLDPQTAAEPLSRLIAQHEIRTMLVTTAYFNHLVRQKADVFKGLRDLIFGGERADAGTARTCLKAAPQRLINAYGPTEGTTISTWQQVTELAPEESSIPIGSPIANSQILVLDRHLEAVGAAVSGELCIAGDGMARGYLNRPATTASVFTPNPHGGGPGARLYRTGDLVRRNSDGAIELIGRIDHQVEVRGYRIDLHQIEAVLSNHEGVAARVVVVQKDASDLPHLVAFIVPTDPSSPPSAGELRRFLRRGLPEYMVPNLFPMLQVLPLTPNGKIDRRSLPHFELLVGAVKEETVAPRDDYEEALEGIWCDVMGSDRLSVFDNFFDLGGHSLLASQLLARVREQLGVDLPLRSIFEVPTIAEMSSLIRAVDDDSNPAPIAPQNQEDYPLSYSQEPHWLRHQRSPLSPEHVLVAVLELRGNLSLQALSTAVHRVVNRHDALRSRFAEHQGVPRQTAGPHLAQSPLDIVDCREQPLDPAQLSARIKDQALQPFDLQNGLPCRFCLLQLDGEHHVFAASAHRIVFDEWSESVLLDELERCYNAYLQSQEPHLPDLSIQFGDFAVHQSQATETGASRTAETGASRTVAASREPGASRCVNDNEPPPVVRLTEVLHQDLAATIRGLAGLSGTSVFVIHLALMRILLHRDAQLDAVDVTCSLLGRERPELELLVGPLSRTAALGAKVDYGQPVLQYLEHIGEVHETLGKTLATKQSSPLDDESGVILIQMIERHAPAFDGLQSSFLDLTPEASRFPLTAAIIEQERALRLEIHGQQPQFSLSGLKVLISDWSRLLMTAADSPASSVRELLAKLDEPKSE